MTMFLSVAAGGAIGAMGRYGVGLLVMRILGAGFPWATLLVNILGCLVMGLMVRFFSHHMDASNELRVFITTGLLGGFTTFSAFSLDFATLIERQAFGPAMFYVVASVVLSLLGVFIGLYVGRVIWP